MSHKLPSLKKMTVPIFLTLTRGIKIKKGGILLSKKFSCISIDPTAVKRFKDYLGWQSNEIPLPYYYIMAQRAQTAIMTHKDFTISVPGMIHLSNELELLKEANPNHPFDIVAKVDVEYKSEGSLIPQFKVNFYQNDQLVIVCKSTYLAKRKTKSGKKKKEKDQLTVIQNPDYKNEWNLGKNFGRQYGKASGDINPIHTSGLFAKIVGFKGMIMQGWYGASRAVMEIENQFGQKATALKVNFESPIYLPGKQVFRFNSKQREFQVIDEETESISFHGKVSVQ